MWNEPFASEVPTRAGLKSAGSARLPLQTPARIDGREPGGSKLE